MKRLPIGAQFLNEFAQIEQIKQDILTVTLLTTTPRKILVFELLCCFNCSDQAGKGLREYKHNQTNTQKYIMLVQYGIIKIT